MEEEISVRETCTLGGGDPCDGAGGWGAGAGWGLVIQGGTSGGTEVLEASDCTRVTLE